MVIYKIKDVVRAIGAKKWDCDSTISNITQAAIVGVFAKTGLADVLAGIADDSITVKLTAAVRRELRQFGVTISRYSITDFADCHVYKLIGNESRLVGWQPEKSAHSMYVDAHGRSLVVGAATARSSSLSPSLGSSLRNIHFSSRDKAGTSQYSGIALSLQLSHRWQPGSSECIKQ